MSKKTGKAKELGAMLVVAVLAIGGFILIAGDTEDGLITSEYLMNKVVGVVMIWLAYKAHRYFTTQGIITDIEGGELDY